jgi:hypothetical protein
VAWTVVPTVGKERQGTTEQDYLQKNPPKTKNPTNQTKYQKNKKNKKNKKKLVAHPEGLGLTPAPIWGLTTIRNSQTLL